MGKAAADETVRHSLEPGVRHCRCGPGFTDFGAQLGLALGSPS
jgi:hypothetical protein